MGQSSPLQVRDGGGLPGCSTALAYVLRVLLGDVVTGDLALQLGGYHHRLSSSALADENVGARMCCCIESAWSSELLRLRKRTTEELTELFAHCGDLLTERQRASVLHLLLNRGALGPDAQRH